jgi:hypothetical protein
MNHNYRSLYSWDALLLYGSLVEPTLCLCREYIPYGFIHRYSAILGERFCRPIYKLARPQVAGQKQSWHHKFKEDLESQTDHALLHHTRLQLTL